MRPSTPPSPKGLSVLKLKAGVGGYYKFLRLCFHFPFHRSYLLDRDPFVTKHDFQCARHHDWQCASCVYVLSMYCILVRYVSPWCNHHGWLCIKTVTCVSCLIGGICVLKAHIHSYVTELFAGLRRTPMSLRITGQRMWDCRRTPANWLRRSRRSYRRCTAV